MHTKLRVIVAIGVVILASGCNNSTNPITTLNPGALSATLQDGSEFISSTAKVTNNSSDYVIYATEDAGLPQNEIHVTVPNDATLPFTVDATNGGDVLYYDVVSNNSYEANNAQGSCSITVTQLSPTFEGTFYARTICTTTSDSVRTLSNGEFNATYQ